MRHGGPERLRAGAAGHSASCCSRSLTAPGVQKFVGIICECGMYLLVHFDLLMYASFLNQHDSFKSLLLTYLCTVMLRATK